MSIRQLSVLSSAFLFACALEPAPSLDDEQADQQIVRGKTETGFPQVVMLHAQRAGGLTRCTGTYIASRVVLTAAHCIRSDVFPGQFFVYYGSNYQADVAMLPNIPAKGSPSPWARAETWAKHPSYSASQNHPDLAFVYLDRALPFAPLPLRRTRLGSDFAGRRATIVGWGADRALTPDLSQVSGVGVKRSGRQTILGSPTAADYQPADPNPGMLVPEIRANLLKLDGSSPQSNTCAGDSGGPVLVEQSGVNQLAGVNFWTGLSCEGYSVATRIDPFLSYIDGGVQRGGSSPIVPRLECVAANTNGTMTAYFGYNNANGVTVNVPHDWTRNSLTYDLRSERPADFGPGDHPWVFGIDFLPTQSLIYRLAPANLPSTTLTVNASSNRCAPTDQRLVCARQCDAALGAACSDGSVSFEQCQRECLEVATQFVGCEREWNTYLGCVANLSPQASRWDCTSGFVPTPVSPYCDAEFNGALACAGF
jgi:secreted trypsin-like serine protease